MDKTILSLCLNFKAQFVEQNFLARLCLICPEDGQNPESFPHIGHLLLINGVFSFIKILDVMISSSISNGLDLIKNIGFCKHLTLGVKWAKPLRT